jgi:hypothetical protein
MSGDAPGDTLTNNDREFAHSGDTTRWREAYDGLAGGSLR